MPEKHYTLAKLVSGLLGAILGEKGFVYTLIHFTRRPGVSLRSILDGQLGNFNEPIRFLFYSVALAAIAMNLIGASGFGIDVSQFPQFGLPNEQLSEAATNLESLRNDPQATGEMRFRIDRAVADLKQSRIEWQMGIFIQWINVFLLMAVPVYAIGTFVLLPRGMNFAEHLVLNAYIYGVQCSVSVLLVPVCAWNYTAYNAIYMVISQIYQVFAWQQILRIRSWTDWLLCGVLVCGSLVAYIGVISMAMLTFLIVLSLIF